MQSSDAERVLELLRALIAMRGIRLRDLEGQIGLSAGTLRRVLKGTIELKFRHITDLLTVLDIPTKTFFRIAFDSNGPDQAAASLAETLRLADDRQPRRVLIDPRDLEAMVVATVNRHLTSPRPEVAEIETRRTPRRKAPTKRKP